MSSQVWNFFNIASDASKKYSGLRVSEYYMQFAPALSVILATWICPDCGSLCERLSFVRDWTSACLHSIPHPLHSQIKKVFDFFLSMSSSWQGWQSLQVKKHLPSWFPFSNLAHSLQSLVPGMHTSIHPCSTPTPSGVEGVLTAQVKGQSILMVRYLCQAISIITQNSLTCSTQLLETF